MAVDWKAIVAYVTSIVGTVTTQVGYILMKKGMHKVENTGLNGGKQKLGFFTCQWIFGFLILGLGSLIRVVVLSFVDLVILSTIGAFSILFNYLLSIIFLGEVIVWKYDVPAISFILGGSLVIIFLSDYSENKYTPELVKELVFSTTSLVCAIVALLITFVTIAQYCWHLKKLKAFNQKAN